ncbi:MAG: HlyD family type I secretion periplasmic adaptor subunit [Sphingobium sp.]
MKMPEFLGDRLVSITAMVCILGLGGFLLWAAFVPLAEGVAATGHVVAEQNRKVVQHLEGGIVRRLAVREGSMVRQGDILVVLDDVRASAERAQAAQSVGALRASVDRLTALANGSQTLTFSATNDLRLDAPKLAAMQAQERSMFEQQRGAFSADRGVLGARRGALNTNAVNKDRQIAAVQSSLKLVRDNLAQRRNLLARQLIRRDSVEQLEQQEANLEVELARLDAERNYSAGQAGEVGEQLVKTRADFLAGVSADLLKARTELQTAEQALRATDDILNRTVLRAPIGGKVLNLAFTTPGGVIRSGEPIMEIVPTSPTLIAQVQIRPGARDAVFAGLHVRAKLNVNKSWDAPAMQGRVLDVSGDLKTVEQTGATYYEARLLLEPGKDLLSRYDVVPGMPVEAYVDSGARRTFLSYLVEPLSDIVRRGLN